MYTHLYMNIYTYVLICINIYIYKSFQPWDVFISSDFFIDGESNSKRAIGRVNSNISGLCKGPKNSPKSFKVCACLPATYIPLS
jgi:hypothetical protein